MRLVAWAYTPTSKEPHAMELVVEWTEGFLWWKKTCRGKVVGSCTDWYWKPSGNSVGFLGWEPFNNFWNAIRLGIHNDKKVKFPDKD